MNMDLKLKISSVLGAKLISSQMLGVGFGLLGLKAALDDGREIAVKADSGSAWDGSTGSLEIEAYMLRELGARSTLPVPEVYHSEPGLLIMSWIANDGGAITPSVARHGAELLAELHGQVFPSFGYGRDTLIGPLHQPNSQSQSQSTLWVDFFREHRLLFMARAAHDEGALSAQYLSRIETFGDHLEELLVEPDHPSLIHGDLWTGNILVKGDRIGGFVDPAIYCAHPEIELAFTTMFGTFGASFFEAYEALRPLEPGFHEVRCEIYNLYPLLVHVRLFGASYLGGIDRVLKRHGY